MVGAVVVGAAVVEDFSKPKKKEEERENDGAAAWRMGSGFFYFRFGLVESNGENEFDIKWRAKI